MAVVCLDTHILIWGVRKWANPNQQANIKKAENLLEQLLKNSDDIIIPSIVVAEFLAGVLEVESSKYKDILNVVNNQFYCSPFDALAADIYAEIHVKKWKQVKGYTGVSRTKMKADMMILAIAKAKKCEVIYTTDKPLSNMCSGEIAVQGLP